MANVHTLNDSPRYDIKPPDIDQSKSYSDRFVDVLAGDTFNGMISGGNVGGRDNNNTYNSGPGIIPIDNDESMTRSISVAGSNGNIDEIGDINLPDVHKSRNIFYGDNFNYPITGGNVGGRGNTNIYVYNSGNPNNNGSMTGNISDARSNDNIGNISHPNTNTSV